MTLLGQIAAIPLGMLYGVALEYSVHRWVFHGLGLRKNSRFRFHYFDHHKAVRQNDGVDPAYFGPRFAWNGYGREWMGVLVGSILHIPLAIVAPGFMAGAYFHGWLYVHLHSKGHRDPEWMKEHQRWHWDHHMGSNPHANWCVTNGWVDRLLGSRVYWTPKTERAESG